MMFLCQRWRHFWFEPATPENLGLCRVIFFGALLLFYWRYDFSLWADVSTIFWKPIWLFDRLELPVLPAGVLSALQAAWKIALALSCLGLFTRISTGTAFILGFYLLGLPHNFGKTHHYDAILVFIFAIMALSRCGDSWSMDRLLAKARTSWKPASRTAGASGEYRWPIRAVWFVMGFIFFAAGAAKILRSGVEWIASDNMAIMLLQHNYRTANADPWVSWGLYLADYSWLCWFFAGSAILFEFGYPLAWFSATARWVVVPGMFLTQVGIRALMGPTFDQFLICNLFWIPWDRVAGRIRSFIARKKPVAVLFDGGCGLCRRTLAVIEQVDLAKRVQPYDVINDWADIQARFPYLNQRSCLEDMHLITAKGKVATGFYAYRQLAWVLPIGWIILPLLYVPGLPLIGRAVYRKVASDRLRNGCGVDFPSEPIKISERQHS